jgi:hypothetical protein
MDLDEVTWVVHRHVVDPRLDELDSVTPATDFGCRPIVPVDLHRDLWGLDTEVLRELALETRNLLTASDEVTSAG